MNIPKEYHQNLILPDGRTLALRTMTSGEVVADTGNTRMGKKLTNGVSLSFFGIKAVALTPNEEPFTMDNYGLVWELEQG